MLVDVDNLANEFYLEVIKTRVLVIIATDVDAVAACRILQQLFHSDNALYTLVPVSKKAAVAAAYRDHCEGIKNVVLLNCGATWDVIEECKPEDDDVVFYIADSNRPVHIHNVYNTSQVRLLMPSLPEEGVPAYEDLFREDEDDDEDEMSIEEVADRRRERREWEERRKQLLFEYTEFSYHGKSTAVTMFEMSWKMTRDTPEILWWAIIGQSEQYISGKIEHNRYVLEAGDLQAHVSRQIQRRTAALDPLAVQISFDQELHLPLYTHWSLMESLRNTPNIFCKFKLWTQKGYRRLQEFLAELGLPLLQCKQQYASMDINLRNNVKEWMCNMAEKYGLENLLFACFTGKCGYRDHFFASDAAFGLMALLESPVDDVTTNFFNALDALSWSNTELLRSGIQLAKERLVATTQQVHSFMDLGSIICAGPFLYSTVQEGAQHSKLFGWPSGLFQLARCALQAYVANTKSRRFAILPLVLAADYSSDPAYTLVVGIPPLSEDSPKNFFGRAFERASTMTHCTYHADFFCSPAVLVYKQDRGKFLDALVSLLV